MDKYILQKDLPDSKAGDSYVWVESMKAYYKDGDISNSYWTAEYVVGNIEWFKEEPELQWFVIPSEISGYSHVKGWTAIKQHMGDMGGYANCVYFQDEESAKKFIIDAKPCLSILDVSISLEGVLSLRMWECYQDKLRQLVKSKL